MPRIVWYNTSYFNKIERMDITVRKKELPKEVLLSQVHPAPTPPMLVNEIARLFHGRMRAFEADGAMTQESARQIMRVLAHEDGCSQLDLVHRTHLKPPTVSISLKRLEAEGLVRRATDDMDMRVVRVYLSEKGAEYNKLIHERLHLVDAELMQGFTERETAELLKYLERMRDNILPDEMKNHS